MADIEKEESNVETKGEMNVSPLSLHNIYKNIHISLRTLDFIIVGLIALLFIVLMIGFNNRGFVIEFDTQGGTPVASQKLMYGDLIEYEEPNREGYRFDGYSRYASCEDRFDPETPVDGSMKLYACWIGD
ncbi:MAG: InlB B-repeat-containing protein [Erysipelotrichaceae bacterium]|nr:InlB B-repeat-containing protein [Erysipelotrichaceae bacterium]